MGRIYVYPVINIYRDTCKRLGVFSFVVICLSSIGQTYKLCCFDFDELATKLYYVVDNNILWFFSSFISFILSNLFSSYVVFVSFKSFILSHLFFKLRLK